MNKTELAKTFEHYETPKWAVKSILDKELLTRCVLEPCVGNGVIVNEINKYYGLNTLDITTNDIYDWGFNPYLKTNFLEMNRPFGGDFTVIMNPPFSLATQFVEKCLDEWNVRKVICFQRFAWRESATRRDFWDKYPPNRIYICGNRATCWRADIPKEERKSGSTTAHAWYVWERGQPKGTLMGEIWKE